MTECKVCELVARRDAGGAPPWDCIWRTRWWDLVHSYNTALPGWLVLVARRHVEAADELSEEEAIELGALLRRASLALKQVTGCVKTYAVLFAEQEGHRHLHLHIVPRMADQPQERRGAGVFAYLGGPPEERVPEATMNGIAARIRGALLAMDG